MTQDKNRIDPLEQWAKQLPVPLLDDQVWSRIESSLEDNRSHAPKPLRRRAFFMEFSGIQPGFKVAFASILLVAISAGLVFSLLQNSSPDIQSRYSTGYSDGSDALDSAGDDLDMAIFYYERAIRKLEHAGDPAAGMKPEAAALYRRK